MITFGKSRSKNQQNQDQNEMYIQQGTGSNRKVSLDFLDLFFSVVYLLTYANWIKDRRRTRGKRCLALDKLFQKIWYANKGDFDLSAFLSVGYSSSGWTRHGEKEKHLKFEFYFAKLFKWKRTLHLYWRTLFLTDYVSFLKVFSPSFIISKFFYGIS